MFPMVFPMVFLWLNNSKDFAWKRCPPKEQRVPISRPRVREVAPGAPGCVEKWLVLVQGGAPPVMFVGL